MNYTKTVGQFVCKMAMPLALMFAACSTDDSNSVSKVEGTPGTQMGGSSEEPRIVALALAGDIGKAYPRMLGVEDKNGNWISPKNESSFVAKKGAVVTAFELDSVTLDTTGRYVVDTVDNDNGEFAFDTIPFDNPYVLVSVLDSCYSQNCQEEGLRYYNGNAPVDSSVKYSRMLTAIVDLREYEKINVNILTHIKTPLLRQYVADGNAFATANEMAEREILGRYGVYADLGGFENADKKESDELAFVQQLVLEYMDNPVGDTAFDRMTVEQYWNTPLSPFFADADVKTLYENTMKMIEYKTGYWAHNLGYGECAEELEDEMIAWNQMFDIVCRSGKWTVGYAKKIDYTKGTMVDSRNGKTYKTGTYNIGGKTQTWMAENLNMEVPEGSFCLPAEDASCDANGRFYAWWRAMNFDKKSIVFSLLDSPNDTVRVPEKCDYSDQYEVICEMNHGTNCAEKSEQLWEECIEEVGAGIEDLEWNYTELMAGSDAFSHQGVCPDGWRIPNVREWRALQKYVEEQYGFDSEGLDFYDGSKLYKVASVFSDEVASGFGVKKVARVERDENEVKVRVYSSEFAAVPDVEDLPNPSYHPGDIVTLPQYLEYGFSVDPDYVRGGLAYSFDFVNYLYFVRCIKDE